ncbi:MAG TPA: hypothetical protein VGG79_09815 [Roseiarcus sp.]
MASYPAPTPDAPPHVRWGGWLFALGVAAGIIMLLSRFTSDYAWWTGHLGGGGLSVAAVAGAAPPLPFCRSFVYCAAQSIG